MAATRPQPKRKGRPQPERSCIVCREVRPKRGLVRLVRVASGGVEIDPTGKRPGRGAYLCQAASCWEKGFHGTIVEHHLHLAERLSPEERQRLLAEGLALAAAMSDASHPSPSEKDSG